MLLITMETFDLLDIQRTRHPNLNIYTYVSKTLNVEWRLVYFLITGSFSQHVEKVGSCPSIAPDHKTIYLDLALPQNTKRGPGFWKFNNLLLNDEEYLFTIHQLIRRLHEKYFQLEDKSLVWELIKMEIRQNTISYAKRKARNMSLHEDELHKRMDKLDQIICNSNDLQNIEDTLKEYDALKAEVNTIYEQKGKAAMFRSKCRWIEEGERPTKYFFNLEKQNFKRKTITELRLEDNKIVSDKDEILKSIEDFYGNLYKSKGPLPEAEFHPFTSELNLPKISDDERGMLEGLFSFEECKEALKCLNDNKSPGEDGFTVEFFECFFNVIGSDLVESFNYAHEKGQLSISQKRALLHLFLNKILIYWTSKIGGQSLYSTPTTRAQRKLWQGELKKYFQELSILIKQDLSEASTLART